MANKVKHIYFVHLLNDNSGSPRVLCDAIKTLECLDYKKTVLTSFHHGFLSDVASRKVKVFYKVFSNRYLKLLSYLLSQTLTFVLLSFNLIMSKLKGEDTIVVVNTLLPFGAGLASRLFSNKTIYYIHETMVNPPLLRRFLLFVADSCSDSILFVSKYVLNNTNIYKPEKNLLYNGLRGDFNSNRELNLESKFESRTVLFVGSLKLYKGIEQFLAVSLQLPKFRFIAAVNCSPLELQLFLKNRVLPENIQFLVRPNNLVELYENASLVINCSIPDECVETFGLSLLEAMSFGCPVIGPPVGGPTEIIENSFGSLIDSRELSKVVSFIKFVHKDFSLWKEYSNNALKRSKFFSSEKYQGRFRLFVKEQFKTLG